MSVGPVASQSALASAATTSTAKNDPSNMDFLQFLVMQLKNQSPLNPANSENMMQQMAMMQMVQETRQLRTELKSWAEVQGLAGSAGLLGRTASVQTENAGVIQGRVDGVAMRQGNPTIRIGTQEYPVRLLIDVH